MAFALPVAFGAPAPDVLLYCGYELGWVLVPGMLVYRLLSPRPGSPLRQVALGWGLGYVLEILAFVGTAAIGERALLYAYPGVVAAAVLPILWRRRSHEHPAAGAAAAPRWGWPLAGVLTLFLVYLGLAHFTLAPLPGPDRTVLYHPDHAFHVSIAAEALHHWPILDSQVAHEPRVYHVFAHIHVAAISQVTHIDLPIVYFRLYLIPLLILLALQVVFVGRRISGNVWTGVVAAGLTLLVGELDMDPRVRLVSGPFAGLFFNDLYQSPSFLLGLVFFLPAILIIHERLTAPKVLAEPGQWVMLGLFLIGCAGAKVSIMPVLLGGLGLFALWDLWTRRRLRGSALVVSGTAVVVMAGFYVAQYRGHSSGTTLDPFASTDAMLGISIIKSWLSGAPGPFGSDAILDPIGIVVGLLALLAAPLVGLPLVLSRRDTWRSPGHVWLLALLVSGLAGFLLIDPNGAFFLFYGYVAGVLLSAQGLVALVSQNGRLKVPLAKLALGACAWLAFLLVVIAVPVALWDPTGLDANGALYFGWFSVLGLALALVWTLARRRAAGSTAAVLVVTGVLVAGALDAPLDNSLRLRHGEKPLYERFFSRGMPGGLYQALRWIRGHTSSDATLAVNRHLSSPALGGSAPRYFYYSAFSERRVFLEDWDFAARTAELKPADPFPERVALNDAAFTAADPWALLALADGAGVTDLVVDRHANQVSPRLAQAARLVFANSEAKVYSIGGRSRVLVRRGGRDYIVDPAGTEITVERGAVRGFVEQLQTEAGRVRAVGWSASRAGAAERILVFVHGRLVATALPTIQRVDVVESLGARAARSGFDLMAPSAAGTEHPSKSDVRVFALQQGRASELQIVR